MATIVIKDLKESVELDRRAMRTITGGWSRQRLSGIPAFQSELFKKPTSFDYFKLSGFQLDPGKF
ncbi:MAG: hypothetical protein PVI91_02110 [Gammaproteobacteria bacterium]|jgi:hypothetical protein